MNNGNSVQNHWYLVSSHGAVLFYVALNPGCTIREIAEEMSLTQRTVWGLIGDLRRAEMLQVRRDGRPHHYTIKLDAQFRHPVNDRLSLRTLLRVVVPPHVRDRVRAGLQ